MSAQRGRGETLEERLQRIRRQAALAAARLKSHRGRCATCGGARGLYGGLCVLGSGLRRESEAAQRVLDGVQGVAPVV